MSKIFEQLVEKRGLTREFLEPRYEECVAPGELPDMAAAVQRLGQAKARGEKVLIYGDYDVDGVTASTALDEALRLAGIEVAEVMLPNRFTDGYGMSRKVVERARETGAKLVVTVDCGSRNQEIVQELLEAGVETVVTDHHECGETLPAAVAVVNPKRRDVGAAGGGAGKSGLGAAGLETGGVELRELAGVGVVFKLAQALVEAGMIPAGQEKWLLDLVLIGTICDSMRLRGENRRLVYYGMKVLEKTRRVGLQELLRTAGVKRLGGSAIGFQVGPRLNAAGRMETAEKALRLLMTRRRTEAAALAMELERLNQERRAQQQAAVREIGRRGVGAAPVIVEAGEWHEGILGIIAGRLVEEYQRPAFVLAQVGDCYKGSGRSFGDFNLAEALRATEKWVIGGGGHAAACGVKVPLGGLEGFTEAINRYYEGLGLREQERFLELKEDLVVEDLAELSLELAEELRQLEPFGEGNGEPRFLLPGVRVVEAARLGADGQHLRLVVEDERGGRLKLMRFFAPEAELTTRVGERVSVWVTVEENVFRGTRSVEGRIERLERA